ncbi:MAG: malto-oligosyltrehalose synthase [Candidatus Sulfotelmatobacter sp.]
MRAPGQIPRATYRLQLNRDFTFARATEIVPYLAALGISHCYVSPCLKARPGSMHGYDIVDHNSFNPEIGTAEEFDRLVGVLHEHSMGLIMDIVPNHMAVMGSDNAWWLDVLENGEASIYASFFDIDWQPVKDELRGKVLVPVLHDHYGAVLESGELKLAFDCPGGDFNIYYRDHRFPVNPREYPRILQSCTEALKNQLGENNADVLEFESLITAFGHLPRRQETGNEHVAERNRDKEIHKRRLAELCGRSPEITASIERAVGTINGNPSDPASFEALHELIKAQAYRLANWRVAADDINYRRFFDTNDLAGICMESETVFENTHRLVLRLIAEGKVDGLRLDHPDGLYDPAQYFGRLRQHIAEAVAKSENRSSENPARYVIVEKILMGTERLPAEWAVCGTTGYEFANLLNGLFVDRAAAMRLERVYRNFTGEQVSVDDLAYGCRKLIIRVALTSELSVLANHLTRIALAKRRTCDFTLNSLRDALIEVVASFPVYRTYVNRSGVSETDANYIDIAVEAAKERSQAGDTSIFDFIRDVLLTRIAEGQDARYRNAVTRFAMKFQQFTSPVMAKGLEDTAFYRYNRLVSLNEVGGDLNRFGIMTSEFHAANEERMRSWPHTMLASSTHDSKRSEDVRARIDVLSEIAGLWRLRARDWRRFNRSHRRVVNERPAPTPNDEYLLYQTLVGAWPLELANGDRNEWNIFSERIQQYMLKAIREAKQNTSWINRNAEYEDAVVTFVKKVLHPDPRNRFLNDFLPFQQRVARIGCWNSLSQTVLKLTSPGVPDIYQGNELLDFSLVDPDNRRPVDYGRRRELLEEMGADEASMRRWMESPDDGRMKLYATWTVLSLRKQHPELFQEGQYVPVEVFGEKAEHVVAFARKYGSRVLLVIAPRLIAGLLGDGERAPVGAEVWKNTRVALPCRECRNSYRNVFSGEVLELAGEVGMAELLREFPVAVWVVE